MTRDQVAAIGDQAIAIVEGRAEYDVDVRYLAEWVALWSHTDRCGYCDTHGLCERGMRLARDLRRASNVDAVHAVAK